MPRLLVHVEGQTEETFVNKVLGPHLASCGYVEVRPSMVGDPRRSGGGITSWRRARKEILIHLRENSGCFVTTMVDYYGLPPTGKKAWPGRKRASWLSFPENARAVEDALLADIRDQMGNSFNPARFVPYVQMHEFEALLFSDCEQFARGIGQPCLAANFQEIRDAFNSPEEIDDSPQTAPSKRVKELMRRYQKPLTGLRALQEIGLDTIRAKCPHFRNWLRRLECQPNSGIVRPT